MRILKRILKSSKNCSKILRRSRNPTQNTRDWTGGLRLTPNQVPVIDHWISPDPTAFGAAIEPSSLNLELRRKVAPLRDPVVK